jgi:hypothetical protein
MQVCDQTTADFGSVEMYERDSWIRPSKKRVAAQKSS